MLERHTYNAHTPHTFGFEMAFGGYVVIYAYRDNYTSACVWIVPGTLDPEA
jgi:hypothetical protein